VSKFMLTESEWLNIGVGVVQNFFEMVNIPYVGLLQKSKLGF